MAQPMTITKSQFQRGCGWLLFIAVLTSATDFVGAQPAVWKFQFNANQPIVGFTQINASPTYSKETGYGFESNATAEGSVAGGVQAGQPFYFSVRVPEGNYRVTVTLGDSKTESDTTVKAELRRLMLEEVKTAKGQIVSRSFVVNVRQPGYPGGEVHLKSPRESETEAWAWDDRLTLEFNGKKPCLNSLVIEAVNVPTVFILGDSTVCDQPREPYASWGQMLPRFFGPDVAISNNAESGETLRSSTQAHRFDKVLSLIKPGDYLLVQYGHNDMKNKAPNAPDEYEATLKKWCESVKAKGGTVILITPVNRHSFDGAQVVNSLGEYPDRVRDAAKAEDVPLIDLNAMSKTLYEAFGPTGSITLFEHAPDSSKFDATHHSPFGAYELAKCIVEGIRQDNLALASHVVADVPRFDPAKPDSADQFDVPASPLVTSMRPLGD